MKNKKLRVLLAFALVAVLTFAIAFSFTASALITDAELTAGRTFEDGEGIQIGKDLDKMPQTYEAVVYVPSGVTEVEEMAVEEAAKNAGAKFVTLIEEPKAAAIGAGIDIYTPNGNIVVDVGGGTADIGTYVIIAGNI